MLSGESRQLAYGFSFFKSEIDIQYSSPAVKVYHEDSAPLVQASSPIVKIGSRNIYANEIFDISFYTNGGSSYVLSFASIRGVECFIFKGDKSYTDWLQARDRPLWNYRKSSNFGQTEEEQGNIMFGNSIHFVFISSATRGESDLSYNLTLHQTEYALDGKAAVCGASQRLCSIRLRYYKAIIYALSIPYSSIDISV